VFYDCIELEERADIGEIHFIEFTDEGRLFYVLVALGRAAHAADVSAAWTVLDQMTIMPLDYTETP
jgi:hypothetical protein